jgi:hypothetical protein
MQQLASARPEDLNAEAKENEGRKPHGDIGATRPQQALDAVGVGETKKKMAAAITNMAQRLASTNTASSVELVKVPCDNPRLITTAMVPGPVVKGSVSG